MKRFIVLFICLLFLLAPAADAAIGSKGLYVNHGATEITIHKGEKKWLYVQDGFSKLPIIKGLSFYSDNTVVAKVGLHSGILRGNSPGNAKLTIVSKKGDCAYITVHVKKGEKISGFSLVILAALILSFLLLFRRLKK